MARARRRPRRAGHRATPANGRAFQTGLDVAQLSRDPRRAARAVAPHQRDFELRLHRVAQRRVEAGDRRGQRRVRRRRAALRRRRRHRDRGVERDVPRPARVGRPGRARTRRSRSAQEVADGGRAAHGARRPPRADDARRARTSSASSSQVVDPPDRAARRCPGARPRRSPGRPADELAADQARALERAARQRTRAPLTRELRAPCMRRSGAGPVGWLINNRPDQLNAMNAQHARRVRGRVERARRRPRGAGDRAHRRGARVPDRRRRHRDRDRRRRACSATASRSRTSTSTSPRGTSEVWKPVITAVNGICAGGGFHWVADADIVIAASRRAVLRPARVDRPGRGDRGDRADAQDAGRGGDAHGVRRPLRAACRRSGPTSSA